MLNRMDVFTRTTLGEPNAEDGLITDALPNSMREIRHIIIRRQERGVSFSVYIDHNADLHYDQVLRFNQVITNEGNGYNKYTGAFTCPQSGVYLLTVTVANRNVAECWMHLTVNRVNIIDAAVDTEHVDQDRQGSNTVIMRLKVGDTVMIKHLDTDIGHIQGANSFHQTSFSGVLLYV